MVAEMKPLVVCDPLGRPIDAVFQNAKGFRKSLENGELWSLHPETGKLLPYAEGVAVTVEERGSWYLARLAATPEVAAPSIPDGRDGVETVPSSPEALAGRDPASGQASLGEVLMSLAEVVRDRHQQMPDGSYTTHLFKGGGPKIRKKTGEEAVEMILAGDNAELTSETADFLYHLLVLLEFEGIELAEIAKELAKR
jgi:phosphoribosyl-ATP pyrophosphohydrolase